MRLLLHLTVVDALRPKFSLSQHLRMQFGEWCDTVIGERGVAVIRANAASTAFGGRKPSHNSGTL